MRQLCRLVVIRKAMYLARKAILMGSVYQKVDTISVLSTRYFLLRMRKLLAGPDLEKTSSLLKIIVILSLI
jgi:hypothetical protein